MTPRALLAASLGLLVICAAAAWNGRQLRDLAALRVRDAALDQQLRLEMARANAASGKVSWLQLADFIAPWVLMPPGPLQGMAAGQDAVRPAARPQLLETFGWRHQEAMENPEVAGFGAFDLALVLLYLYPLYLLCTRPGDGVARRIGIGLGLAASLIAFAVSGAPLAAIDSWLRLAAWLGVTFLWANLWLVIRDAIGAPGSDLEPGRPWMRGAAYALLVVALPAVVGLLTAIVIPPEQPAQAMTELHARQAGTAAARGRALLAAYDAHPDLLADPTALDRAAAPTAAAARASQNEAEQAAAGGRRWREIAAGFLRLLAPGAAAHGAWLEAAGSGDSRYAGLLDQGREFANQWTAHFTRAAGSGAAAQADSVGGAPAFRYQEQSALGWLPGAALAAAGLYGWTLLIPRLASRIKT